MQLKQLNMKFRTRAARRTAYAFVLLCIIALGTGTVLLIKAKEFALEMSMRYNPGATQTSYEPFPVGVNPTEKKIHEDPTVYTYFEKHISTLDTPHAGRLSFADHVLAQLSHFSWFQTLASPISRILVILPGERKEEVAHDLGDILGWDKDKQNTFLSLVSSSSPAIPEGKFYPSKYLIQKDATPHDVARLVTGEFNTEMLSRYTDTVASTVPLSTALTIASLLEREAGSFTDMRDISGIIWNRLFVGMNLQVDASLQYAKGSRPDEPWWPKVVPDDKYIKSPYNTYQNPGLPPAPIDNPSPAAVLAALNPASTTCMYYFHDKHGNFHCATTYKEHVALLKKYYGQGR
jgi:UPF0755 protein